MLPDIVRRVDRRQPACRSALPQAAFLPRKNSAGLFGEGKSDDDKEENRRNTCVFQGSMTQSALICTWGPRKVARPCGVRRTHHSGEGCPLGSARLKRRLCPTKKRVCPCQTKVWILPKRVFPADRDKRTLTCKRTEFIQNLYKSKRICMIFTLFVGYVNKKPWISSYFSCKTDDRKLIIC